MINMIIKLCWVVTGGFLLISFISIIFAENNPKHDEGVNVYKQRMVNQQTVKEEILTNSELIDKRLFNAARKGDHKLIERLVREGFDVNQKNENGATPLHLAVANDLRKPKAVIVLLKAGAEINAQDKLGSTPLLYSMYAYDGIEYARLLVEHGADVNLTRNNGETPLHVAASWTATDIFKLLLEKGANPNAVNDEGESPFMKTVRNYVDVDLIRLCIKKGANVHLLNKEDKSALMLAEEALTKARTEVGKKRLLEIIEELKNAGATS